jgi:hyaluronoglucosaminidase
MLRIFAAALTWALLAATARAEVNIAPGAVVTASSWNEKKIVVDARDDIPRNAVDESLATGWRPAPGASGKQWLRLDFTRPWPMTYAWKKLVTEWREAPASYRWEVSSDGRHWQALATRSKPGTKDSVDVAGTGSYLRLVVPEGSDGLLLETAAYSGSGGAGKVAKPTLKLEGNQAFLDWSGGAARNVFVYRLQRTASLTLGGGSSAGTTALVEVAPVTRAFDRVDYPNVAGIAFDYQWKLEAFAPNGERIGRSESTERTTVTVRSPRPFLMRGVVEGYYGPGYSDTEREDLVRFTGSRGGNFYLYAPKLDPLHREKWREPYPKARLDAFGRLLTIGQDQGVRFAWSLSPGLDFDGSAADTEAVVAKYKALHEMGMRWFGLLMDDIPATADVTEANKQVALANTVLDRLRETDPQTYLIFVPTVYFGEAGGLTPAHERYLRALRNLRADTIVMWTGTEVFSPVLTHELVDPIAVLVGHPIVIWDNFPVADYFLGKRANLGGVIGRAANLGDPVGLTQPVVGLLANPLALPAANRFPLASVLDYLRDPAAYSPAASLRDQLKREAPETDTALLERWLAAFGTDGFIGVNDSAATRAVSAATEALAAGAWPDAGFAKHAAALYAAEPALRRLYHPDLAGDLLPLAAKSALLGEAELRVLRAMSALASDNDAGTDLAAAEELLAKARASSWIITEGMDEAYLAAAVKLTAAPQGAPPALRGSLPTRVAVGSTISARFALGDATTSTILGLPGAKFTDGRLTWQASHTGTERWVVVAANARGAAVRFGEIAVERQEPSDDSGGCAAGGPGAWTPLALAPLAALAWRRRARIRLYIARGLWVK